MRKPDEMMDLILSFAKEHDAIRAVLLNGSRVNHELKQDPFQDYDVVYIVNDLEKFINSSEIPEYFGEIMIMQLPEDMKDPPPTKHDSYVYLMQFMDGTRIDLGINRIEDIHLITDDSLTQVLLDKDNILTELPAPSLASHLPDIPTNKGFADCCNEFWWLNIHVAKGIWRDELPYAKFFFETLLRSELMKMIVWDIAIRTNRQAFPGWANRHIQKHMLPSEWICLVDTYVDADPNRMWKALSTAGKLFRTIGNRVALVMDFSYPSLEDSRVTEFVQKIRNLPKDAIEI